MNPSPRLPFTIPACQGEACSLFALPGQSIPLPYSVWVNFTAGNFPSPPFYEVQH